MCTKNERERVHCHMSSPAMHARALLVAAAAAVVTAQCVMPDARPAPSARKFVSSAVDDAIAALRPRFIDPNLGTLFANTLPNTLDTVR